MSHTSSWVIGRLAGVSSAAVAALATKVTPRTSNNESRGDMAVDLRNEDVRGCAIFSDVRSKARPGTPAGVTCPPQGEGHHARTLSRSQCARAERARVAGVLPAARLLLRRGRG